MCWGPYGIKMGVKMINSGGIHQRNILLHAVSLKASMFHGYQNDYIGCFFVCFLYKSFYLMCYQLRKFFVVGLLTKWNIKLLNNHNINLRHVYGNLIHKKILFLLLFSNLMTSHQFNSNCIEIRGNHRYSDKRILFRRKLKK